MTENTCFPESVRARLFHLVTCGTGRQAIAAQLRALRDGRETSGVIDLRGEVAKHESIVVLVKTMAQSPTLKSLMIRIDCYSLSVPTFLEHLTCVMSNPSIHSVEIWCDRLQVKWFSIVCACRTLRHLACAVASDSEGALEPLFGSRHIADFHLRSIYPLKQEVVQLLTRVHECGVRRLVVDVGTISRALMPTVVAAAVRPSGLRCLELRAHNMASCATCVFADEFCTEFSHRDMAHALMHDIRARLHTENRDIMRVRIGEAPVYAPADRFARHFSSRMCESMPWHRIHMYSRGMRNLGKTLLALQCLDTQVARLPIELVCYVMDSVYFRTRFSHALAESTGPPLLYCKDFE